MRPRRPTMPCPARGHSRARAGVRAALAASTIAAATLGAGAALGSGSASAAAPGAAAPTEVRSQTDPTTTLPTEQADCISALPKPGCADREGVGSEQYLVLAAMLGGLAIIGTVIVRSSMRTSRARAETLAAARSAEAAQAAAAAATAATAPTSGTPPNQPA